MPFTLEAACLCDTGKVRKNNEDNFTFDGRCLPAENSGLTEPLTLTAPLRRHLSMAVLDGMGGENFGEFASFAAADHLKEATQKGKRLFTSTQAYLKETCLQANEAVVAEQRRLQTGRMGSTLVAFYFTRIHLYACNLGDSRAYRLREGELEQLSEDHIEKREGQTRKKAPLTQHLGIDPEDFRLEPCIVKSALRKEDQYLLCSDGLTDMLLDEEIAGIMSAAASAAECARRLVEAALEKGGRDNVTVIVCRIG